MDAAMLIQTNKRNTLQPAESPIITGTTKPSEFSPHSPKNSWVCLECLHRDEDVADVDIASPGVWEHETETLEEGDAQEPTSLMAERTSDILNSTDRLETRILEQWLRQVSIFNSGLSLILKCSTIESR